MSKMRAIILAGGKGTRLKPYTTLIPKPLVPLGGESSVLEMVISQLAKAGFTHITLAVNHLADLVMAYFGNGKKWGVLIDYSLENKPLNTVGPLTLIKDLPENFLVMNADILCNLNFKEFYKGHVKRGSLISVAACSRDSVIDFGVLKYDRGHCLTEFREKPVYRFDVSMGIYCLNRSVIKKLPKGKAYGFDQLMLDGIKNKDKIRIEKFNGFWLDIGRPEDYQYADEHFKEIVNKLGYK
ncbi:MAG: sugar phosphate nucleotidyltransferase [Candidatus Omnitrophica bacterium]|nr:sugar phosphate nucleotidyltransferase [Candidatus Omnitrophota bacterium]